MSTNAVKLSLFGIVYVVCDPLFSGMSMLFAIRFKSSNDSDFLTASCVTMFCRVYNSPVSMSLFASVSIPNGLLLSLFWIYDFLAFCRNITHARMMAEELGEFYHTAYLTGKNSVGERISAYNDLQDDTKDLEILFTVDILNEGVDIPGVNMVLFLRPTDSQTIFIQQLGRGLSQKLKQHK